MTNDQIEARLRKSADPKIIKALTIVDSIKALLAKHFGGAA
jgi:hypothetical protein